MQQMAMNDARRRTESAMRQAAPWLQALARLGYVAKGVIYVVIGVLALGVASGIDAKTTDTSGALTVILREPFGRILLMVVIAGLCGYALRRFVQAYRDPEHEGKGLRGMLTRTGYVMSGLVYALLAVTAVKLIHGVGQKKNMTQHWTAQVMHLPFGQWIVAVVGAIILLVGIYGVFFAVAAKFRKHLAFRGIGPATAAWLTHLGRFGYCARGIVFIVVGMFLMQAGVHADPNTAKGMDGAQDVVAHWSGWALYLIAAGLISFGVFMFVEAKFNRMAVT